MRVPKRIVASKHIKSKYTRIAVAVVFIIAALVKFVYDYKSYNKAQQATDRIDGVFSAHFIDIGQGDATLLKSPDGSFMLIDCGPTLNDSYLVKYLSDMGVKSLDYLLITHPHEDHYGGAPEIMENFEVEAIILHKDFAQTYPYDRLIYMAEDNGTEVVLAEKGDNFRFDGSAEFEIIAPGNVDNDDFNESSLCFRVVFGDTSFMFTGDAESDTEYYMLKSGAELKSDVLQAGHHGSSTSNTRSFVEAVAPRYAVVSCEKDNEYGHPHRETVETFESLRIKMLKTSESGSIVFISDGKEVTYLEDFF